MTSKDQKAFKREISQSQEISHALNCISLNNFASTWPSMLKFLQSVYFTEIYHHIKYKENLEA